MVLSLLLRTKSGTSGLMNKISIFPLYPMALYSIKTNIRSEVNITISLELFHISIFLSKFTILSRNIPNENAKH